jgi:tetratricopeptide (TPR) repeat protein
VSDVESSRLDLARHYAALGRHDRVLETLEDARALTEPEGWALRGEALYHLDRYAEGASAARRGLEIDPEDATLLDVLALNLMEKGDLAGAERALLAALDVWPEDETLLCHYALACAKHGQREKAYKLLDRAAALEPESIDVLRVRAQVAFVTGDDRATKRLAGEVLKHDPEDRIAHILRGNVEAERNPYAAVRHHTRAVRLDPSDRELADVVRQNRILTHPLQWPIYLIQRFGPMKIWGTYIALLILSIATDQLWLTAILVPIYLFMVVYSWTIAPLARWWMERRLR